MDQIIKRPAIIILLVALAVSTYAQLRVMSFNIRFDNPKDTALTSWQMRKDPCARMIRAIKPDVIGIQEPRGDVQVNDIQKILPDYTSLITMIPSGQNLAKLSKPMIFFKSDKFKLLRHGQFWLNKDISKPGIPFGSTDTSIRAVLWIKLLDLGSGKTFYFATTHLPYKKDSVDNVSRAKCAALIVRQMKKLAGDNTTVFVVGDMNASFDLNDKRRNSLTPFYYWFLSARDMATKTDNKSSFNGFATQNYPWPRTIDYIFYRNAVAANFETHDENIYGVPFVSDHFPIVCDFTY